MLAGSSTKLETPVIEELDEALSGAEWDDWRDGVSGCVLMYSMRAASWSSWFPIRCASAGDIFLGGP